MSELRASSSRTPKARLRATVAKIERELAPAAEQSLAERAGAPSRLRASFRELVAELELGPAPALRRCPSCRGTCMRDATRCGFCWEALPPLALGAETALTPGVAAATKRRPPHGDRPRA